MGGYLFVCIGLSLSALKIRLGVVFLGYAG